MLNEVRLELELELELQVTESVRKSQTWDTSEK
jgi:hypothetical protein